MPQIRTLPGARWDCHSCGNCCRFYELGPVEPEVIRRLEAERVEEKWAPAAGGWYDVRTTAEGEQLNFLRHIDGHCVFLRDDQLCAIHGLYGADAKPGFCREYPFHVLEDPKGLVAVVRSSCAGYHASYADGQPVENHGPGVVELPRVVPRRRFAPDRIAVLPDLEVGLDEWMAWEQRLLDAIAAPDEPERAIARLRRELYTLAGRAEPSPDPHRARMAAGAVIEALRRLMAKAAADPDPTVPPIRLAFARDAAAMLEQALPGLTDPGALSVGARDWLHLLLRTAVLAKSFQGVGSVAEGLGATILPVLVVRAAAERGPDGISAAAASTIVVRWTQLVENRAIAGVLRLARPALLDLFLNVQR